MLTNLENQITDIADYVSNNEIKLIPLKKHRKEPKGKDWFNNSYTLEDFASHDGNIGIRVGYNHEQNGKSLAIIDIDGYKDKLHPEWQKITSDFIYDCLKEIPGALVVRTQSGGIHIYLWNRSVHEKVHEVSKNLHFPEDFEVDELRGKSMKHSIEIFTKDLSKQCVAPGSIIKNRGSDKIRDYTVISEVNKLSDVVVVNDIWDTVKEAMVNKGCTYHTISEPEDTNKKNTTKKLKKLTDDEINQVSECISNVLKKLEGSKHYAALDLGGYFSRNITSHSCRKICNEIIKKVDFDDDRSFIHTVMQNYEKVDVEHIAGLPSFIRLLEDFEFSQDEIDKIVFRIKSVCSPVFYHDIMVHRKTKDKTKYLRINYTENVISYYTKERKWFNDNTTGELTSEVFIVDQYDVLNISPLKIYESFNILEKQASPKLCFTFYRKGMPYKQTLEGNDVEIIEKQLSKRPGIVLKPREYKGLLNEIIKEYVRLDLIHTVEDIPVAGIFINPLTDKLARADKNGIVPIVKPKKEDVLEGLKVWGKLYDVYTGDSTKLSHILRYGLVCPFSYIVKTHYAWYRLLFLYGASQTAKTTLSEIALCPYTDIDDEVSVGGASVNTEYRLGNALSRQGYGVVINEPGQFISSNDDILELIKRAIESAYCREKMDNGVHVKIPAYANMIFTSNAIIPTKDAFVRRSEFLEFTSSERMSEENKAHFNKVFNHKNWRDTDFLKLRAVGDFVVWYVAENMDVLGLSKKEFTDKLLDELYGYCGVETPKWLYKDAELMDISNSDNEILDEFRGMVLKDYRQLTANSHVLLKLSQTIDEVTVGESLEDFTEDVSDEYRLMSIFREITKQSYLDYLHYQNVRGVEYIVVNSSIKRAMAKVGNNQITCKGLADYMNCEYKAIKYGGKNIKGFRLSLNAFVSFLKTGIVQ